MELKFQKPPKISNKEQYSVNKHCNNWLIETSIGANYTEIYYILITYGLYLIYIIYPFSSIKFVTVCRQNKIQNNLTVTLFYY